MTSPLSGVGRRFWFDLETNGFLDVVTVVHSLVLKDLETGEVISCADQPGYVPIAIGVRMLAEADQIVGHNIIKYDIQVLGKLYGFKIDPKKVRDTLVLSRLIHADIADADSKRLKAGTLPGKLFKSHALEAWGWRLGDYKGDYGKDENGKAIEGVWETWNAEMQDYCVQDVEVTAKLWRYLKPDEYSQTAIELEHRVAWLCARMERDGFPFDVPAAGLLHAKLAGRVAELSVSLKTLFPPWVVNLGHMVPKRNDPKFNYTKGAELTRVKLVEFNPGSRSHIARCLAVKYDWKPTEFTPGGDPQVDDEVLSKLPWPEAQALAEYFVLQKRIGQLFEGDKAWLKLERNGRIHASYTTNGAVTGRATHGWPNIAQVPKVGSPYGAECRALFHAPAHWVMVGADMSGLELRCLAHYLALAGDKGNYARIVTQGDVHWTNAVAMGLVSGERNDHLQAHKLIRNGAKTFIYAFLYGAGAEKIGSIVLDVITALKRAGCDEWKALAAQFFGTAQAPNKGRIITAGKRLMDTFTRRTPGLKTLKDRVKSACSKGWILGLDGRRLAIRSDHSALNTLLQACGAILCKQWMVETDDALQAAGLRPGWDNDYVLAAWVHDETQSICKEGLQDDIGRVCVEQAERVGTLFEFRCPLASEFKSGRNWAETH